MRAVKIVYLDRFEERDAFEREFNGLKKFEPISRTHEGLVDILQVGRTEECLYYVMELADEANSECNVPPSKLGETNGKSYVPCTLHCELARRGRLPAERCIQIGLKLTSALAHLHGHGLVHRDVKPSNIIFVNGQPKLADVGLVAETTEARTFVGTAGFIPPEGPGNPQADLYSLGKVLYEAGTGLNRHEFPNLPGNLRSFPDCERLAELNEVILNACDDDPRCRYQTAAEMHGELRLLEAGRSVRRLRVRKHRLAFGRKAIVLGALVALLTSAFIYHRTKTEGIAQKAAAMRSGIRPDRVALMSSEMEKYLAAEADFRFADGFNDEKSLAWRIEPFTACQSNTFTALVTNQACQIKHHPQTNCPGRRIRFTPRESAIDLSDVRASVDVLDWDGTVHLAIMFRRDAPNRHTYLAGLSTSPPGSESGKSLLWFFEVSNGREGEMKRVELDRLDPQKDYRLVLLAVGRDFLLRLFELDNLEEPLEVLKISDSSLIHGGVVLYMDMWHEQGGRVRIDNFSLTGVKTSSEQLSPAFRLSPSANPDP
jgi:hypothetical protein